jgi:hypothetical protein
MIEQPEARVLVERQLVVRQVEEVATIPNEPNFDRRRIDTRDLNAPRSTFTRIQERADGQASKTTSPWERGNAHEME